MCFHLTWWGSLPGVDSMSHSHRGYVCSIGHSVLTAGMCIRADCTTTASLIRASDTFAGSFVVSSLGSWSVEADGQPCALHCLSCHPHSRTWRFHFVRYGVCMCGYVCGYVFVCGCVWVCPPCPCGPKETMASSCNMNPLRGRYLCRQREIAAMERVSAFKQQGSSGGTKHAGGFAEYVRRCPQPPFVTDVSSSSWFLRVWSSNLWDGFPRVLAPLISASASHGLGIQCGAGIPACVCVCMCV